MNKKKTLSTNVENDVKHATQLELYEGMNKKQIWSDSDVVRS